MAKYLREENGYEVRKAYGGAEGLGMVEQRRPDLIILDLMMPEVDGFDVIGRLKEGEDSRDIPIIVVTAKGLAQEEAKYLKGNIERIVRKAAFSREELLKDIRRALEKIEV
jgi:CheY-like chemotaxis protein